MKLIGKTYVKFSQRSRQMGQAWRQWVKTAAKKTTNNATTMQAKYTNLEKKGKCISKQNEIRNVKLNGVSTKFKCTF